MNILNTIHGIMHRFLKLLTISPQGVSLLPMHRVVSAAELLLRHPERDDNPNQQTDQARDHDVQDDNEHDSEYLNPHLLEPGPDPTIVEAVGETDVVLVVVDEVEEAAEVGVGEEAGEEAA